MTTQSIQPAPCSRAMSHPRKALSLKLRPSHFRCDLDCACLKFIRRQPDLQKYRCLQYCSMHNHTTACRCFGPLVAGTKSAVVVLLASLELRRIFEERQQTRLLAQTVSNVAAIRVKGHSSAVDPVSAKADLLQCYIKTACEV